MAKQTEGIVGGFQGRVGPVIGYRWRGRWVMRSCPSKVRDPKSKQQMQCRAQFKAEVRLASRLQPVLRRGMHWPSIEAGMTEGNWFVHVNKQCFGWADEALTVNYPTLLLADGTLAKPLFGDAMRDRQCVEVSFAAAAEGVAASPDDEVLLAAWCPDRDEVTISKPVYRRDGNASIQLPERLGEAEVHLYGFARDVDGRCSQSEYIGLPSTAAVEEFGNELGTSVAPKASLDVAPQFGTVEEEEPTLVGLVAGRGGHVDGLHRGGVDTGVVHLGRESHGRGGEVLYLLQPVAHLFHLHGQISHVIQTTTWMAAYEIGYQLVAQARLLANLIKTALGFLEQFERWLAHKRQHMVRGMLRCHLKAPGGVV